MDCFVALRCICGFTLQMPAWVSANGIHSLGTLSVTFYDDDATEAVVSFMTNGALMPVPPC